MPLVPDRTPDRAPLDRYCDELERMARAFALPVEFPEPDGIALAARYDRAARDYVEFRIPEGLTRDEADRLRWEHHLIELKAIDARDALRLHIFDHGPVETEAGTYRLAGNNRLTFRRDVGELYRGRVQCPN